MVFVDVVGFTQMARDMRARVLVAFLGYTFFVMDEVCDATKMWKIKTIGDAYLAVGGIVQSGTRPQIAAVVLSQLPARTAAQVSGSSTSSAIVQRSRLKVMGGIQPAARRPTMVLPAHSRGGITSSTAVPGVIF